MKKYFAMAIVSVLLVWSNTALAAPIVGVTASNQLITFDSAKPQTVYSTIAISGLQSGEAIVGVDFRPGASQLFALTNASRMYQINPATGVVTRMGSDGSFALSGNSFGVDFNPSVDRIRVVSDLDQNLRLNPNDGTLTSADVALAYDTDTDGVGGPDSGDVNAGANPSIVAAAYSNNLLSASSTTLYGIDSSLGTLVTQNPPNNGTLNTVGALGVTFTGPVGFDILTSAGPTDAAFASLQVAGSTGLYSISLTTGAASLIGTIGNGSQSLVGLSVGCSTPVLSVSDISVTEGNSSTTPGVVTAALSAACVAPIQVSYATIDATANATVDYHAASGTLLFGPNETSKTISVSVIGDTLFETNETFTIDLSNALGASINDSSATVTITNDDGPVTDVRVEKTVRSKVNVGREMKYEIDVTNSGSFEASNVVLSDPLPGRLNFLKATPSQGTCQTPKKNRKGGTVTCSFGNLQPGQTVSVFIRGKVVGPPRRSLNNSASVTSDTADSDLTNNTSSTSTRVQNPSSGSSRRNRR